MQQDLLLKVIEGRMKGSIVSSRSREMLVDWIFKKDFIDDYSRLSGAEAQRGSVRLLLTARTPGSAPGPTRGNEYKETSPLPLFKVDEKS